MAYPPHTKSTAGVAEYSTMFCFERLLTSILLLAQLTEVVGASSLISIAADVMPGAETQVVARDFFGVDLVDLAGKMKVEDGTYYSRRALDITSTPSSVSVPTACDPDQEMWLVLWDAEKDVPIGKLGNTIRTCDYDVELSIEAKPECKSFVKFQLYDGDGNRLRKTSEGSPPFMLGEDISATGDVLPVPELKEPGSYSIMVNPKPGRKQTFSLQVLEC